MGFSAKRTLIRNSVVSTVKVIVLTASLLAATSTQAATIHISNNDSGHLSTLQVKTAVKKLHKGRIIYTKRTVKPGFPNCHVIKMITTTGEFKYIRYACS